MTGNYPQSDELVIEGWGFGDSTKEVDPKISIKYGHASDVGFECKISDDKEGERPQVFHTKASCKTSYGNGYNLPFKISVAGQTSDWSFDTFSYADTPAIKGVSGCFQDPTAPVGQKTINCDTRGVKTDAFGSDIPIIITIIGRRFGDDAADLNVFIRGEVCANPVLFGPTNLTCTLPRGTGSRVPVMISRHQFLSAPQSYLSYGIPKVLGILGCSSTDRLPLVYSTADTPEGENGAATDCPRESNNRRITIYGENFGYQNAEVYVAGEECIDVIHNSTNPHRVITCILPEPQDTGAERTVVVIQENGESSRENSGRLSYKKCEPGWFHNSENFFRCAPCTAGSYTAQEGLTICNDCNKGEYNTENKSTSCTPCPRKQFQQSEGESTCMMCESGRYAAQPGSWTCQTCDAGTYVHVGLAEDGQWVEQCLRCPSFGVECAMGMATAKTDYYLYPDTQAIAMFSYPDEPDYFPNYTAYRCPPNYCSPEPNQPCAKFRTGLLCGECVKNYYPSGDKCYPCKFSNEGLLLIPFLVNWILVLFVFMTSRDDGSSYDGITKIFLFFVQTTTLFFTINKLGSDFSVFLAFFTFNSLSYMNFNVNDIGEGMCFQSTALLNLNTGIIQPLVSVFQLLIMLCVHFIVHTIQQKRNESSEPFSTGSYRRAFVALFLFVFYSLASSCVQILACVPIVWQGIRGTIEQDVVVVSAPSVSCNKYPYDILKIVAILILVTMALLALVSLAKMIQGYKKGFFKNWKDEQIDALDRIINEHSYDPELPEYKKALQEKVDITLFYSHWSGVFRGYNVKNFYWEYVMLVRRTSVICIVSFLHEAYDRYFGLSLVCIGSLVLHVISYPFSEPRAHVVNVRPGQYAWNLLKSVNHFETLSLSVLALLVQLHLSEDPDRDAIIITKVSLILFTLVILGFTLIYVVYMEKIGHRICSKYIEKDDDNDKVEAVEEEEDKDLNNAPPDVDAEDNIPQAVDEEQDKQEDFEDPQKPQKETNDDDSDDPYAVHKPPKNTDDADTGDDDTAGDTLETDGLHTGDTTDSIDENPTETYDALDANLDKALAASALDSAAKNVRTNKKKTDENPDLDAALAASAKEAVLQASKEDIDLDAMMKAKK